MTRHLPHSVDYSNADEIIDELDSLPFDEVKQIMRDIIEDNGNLLKVSERAAIALDQYKELVSLVDGIILEDEENLKEKAKNSIAEIFLRLIFSMKNTSYWLMILSDIMKKYASQDKWICDLILVLKGMSKGILAASRQLKYKPSYKRISNKEKRCFLRNLERSKKPNGQRTIEKSVCDSQNLSENKDDENKNTMQSDSEVFDEEPRKSESENKGSLQDVCADDEQVEATSDKSDDEQVEVTSDKCDEEQVEATSDKSDDEQIEATSDKSDDEQVDATSDKASLSQNEGEKSDEELNESSVVQSENEITEGETNGYSKSHGKSERLERSKEKTFGISYLITENLFRNNVVEGRKTYRNISRKGNETSSSSAFDKQTRTFRRSVNKGIQSSNIYKKDINQSKKTSLYNASVTASKGPRRYRKRTLNTREDDTDINGIEQSETNKLNFPAMTKRLRRSSNYQISSKHNDDSDVVSEKEPKSYRKFKKDNLCINSETKSNISSEKPKRRGRRKKLDAMQRQEMMENIVPSSEIKYACVHLTDVLEDPDAKRYFEGIRLNRRKKKENIQCKEKRKKRKENNETEETRETNEMEVSQEWNVLDAVSDEDDKDIDNGEDSGGLNNENIDEQVMDSDADQEQNIEDDEQEQPENDDEHNDSIQSKHDERCHTEHDDNSSNHSTDSETKLCKERSNTPPSVSSPECDSERKQRKRGPTTPSLHQSSPELQFNSEDENEAEEESIRSDEEVHGSPRSPPSEPLTYGKMGPRTPPSPPMLCPSRRGPQTPPGSGPELEVSGRPFESL